MVYYYSNSIEKLLIVIKDANDKILCRAFLRNKTNLIYINLNQHQKGKKKLNNFKILYK